MLPSPDAETIRYAPPSLNQQNMHNRMIEQTKENRDGWIVHLLEKFFDPRRLNHEAAIGTWSWTCADISTKWLYQPIVRNYGGGWVTPSEIARTYLTLKYPKRRIKCTWAQKQACVLSRGKPPKFALPGIYEDAVYIDLDAAYWQIVRAVGWNVNYSPGEYLSVHSNMLDFPYKHEKMARNCLVSLGLPHRMRLWTGTELKFVARPNPLINLILYRLVMDVLNGVAADVFKAGAVYIYADGYIVPTHHAHAVYDAIAAWGLTASIRHDPHQESAHAADRPPRFDTEIRAPGSYRVGDYQSLPYQRSQRRRAIMDFYDPTAGRRCDGGWLRSRFRLFAEKAITEWEFAE